MCSRCNQPCAQDRYSEYCEDHSWLYRKVKICQLGAFLLLVLNVGATGTFLNVSPLILVGVIYINGAIQQALAFIRTVGHCMKRLGRAACCVPTATNTNYVKLTQKDPDILSK